MTGLRALLGGYGEAIPLHNIPEAAATSAGTPRHPRALASVLALA